MAMPDRIGCFVSALFHSVVGKRISVKIRATICQLLVLVARCFDRQGGPWSAVAPAAALLLSVRQASLPVSLDRQFESGDSLEGRPTMTRLKLTASALQGAFLYQVGFRDSLLLGFSLNHFF